MTALSSSVSVLSADGARVLDVLAGLVEPLWRSLPTDSEVVLHELGMLPNSIVAIAGSVTTRKIGDPATDLLLEQLRNVDKEQNKIDYQSVLPDGRRLRSTTMIVRDIDGVPVAALCINTDISDLLSVRDTLEALVTGRDAATLTFRSTRQAGAVRMERQLVGPDQAPVSLEPPGESFPRSVDELVSQLIEAAISSTGVPVGLMRKHHKMLVVEQLESKGLFLLKDAVELIAIALGVTRFTIYNYLNELGTAGKTE